VRGWRRQSTMTCCDVSWLFIDFLNYFEFGFRLLSGDAWFFFPFVFERIKGWQIAQSTMTCHDVLWFFHVCESYPFGSMIFDQSLMWLRIDCKRDLSPCWKKYRARNILCFAIFSFTGECSLLWLTFHDILFVLIRTRSAIISSSSFLLSFYVCFLNVYLTECAPGFMKWRSRRMFSFRDTNRIHHDGRRTFSHQRSIFFLFSYMYIYVLSMSSILSDYFVKLIYNN